MDKLIAGGPSEANLPPNWIVPHGWPLRGDVGAIYVGEHPALEREINRVKAAGWTVDEASLVGIFDPEWSAEQYKGQDTSGLEPWDFLPRPGGRGSLSYQMQLVPDGVDQFARPRIWIFSDDSAKRAQGGEPVHRVNKGAGHWEYHEGARPGTPAEGLEFQWDRALCLWRVKD